MTENQAEFQKGLTVVDKRHAANETQVVQSTSNDAIMLALQKGTDPAIIEKLMDLAERQEANIAKKAYVSAMAKWKANAPEIAKDRHVKFNTSKGVTEYKHASLANVAHSINESMAPFGLHTSWTTEQPDNLIKVTCTATHEMGHSESTCLSAPADNTGNKNTIQALGSTISYLERYTLLSLVGLATHEMDDDGQAAGPAPEPITEDQIADINTLLFDLYKTEKIKDENDFAIRLKRLYKVETVDKLTKDQANSLLKKLGEIK